MLWAGPQIFQSVCSPQTVLLSFFLSESPQFACRYLLPPPLSISTSTYSFVTDLSSGSRPVFIKASKAKHHSTPGDPHWVELLDPSVQLVRPVGTVRTHVDQDTQHRTSRLEAEDGLDTFSKTRRCSHAVTNPEQFRAVDIPYVLTNVQIVIQKVIKLYEGISALQGAGKCCWCPLSQDQNLQKRTWYLGIEFRSCAT